MDAETTEQAAGSSSLVRALTAGRAVLLLGQRHTPGLLDSLKRDVAAITSQDENLDFIRLLAGAREDAVLEGLRRAFERHPVSPDLLALAGNPWPYVITSAIDPQVHEAFQRAGAAGRQLRVLFAGQTSTLARPGRGTLTLLRLFGALDEREPAYRPPTSDLELRKRTKLELALVLNELPVLIGPGGHLIVAGVGSDDWLDIETLALSCGDLPDASVHWFASEEQPLDQTDLEELFGNRLRFHSGQLSNELATIASEEERAALERAREQLVHPGSRHITIRRDGTQVTVTLAPQEWRRLSQVALVLDDEVTQTPPRLGEAEERQAFRDFLYRVQRLPAWEGIARGFLFERAAAPELLALVAGELTAPRSVHASNAAGDNAPRRSSP